MNCSKDVDGTLALPHERNTVLTNLMKIGCETEYHEGLMTVCITIEKSRGLMKVWVRNMTFKMKI